jgi:hypothetical protein
MFIHFLADHVHTTKLLIIFCIFSFGYFPGVRLSFPDVSEPSVRSIFKGLMKDCHYYYYEHVFTLSKIHLSQSAFGNTHQP